MSGLDYRVTTGYFAEDHQTPVIAKIASASKDAAAKQVDLLGGIGKAGDFAAGIFDSVASKVMSVAKVIGAAGVAAVGLGTKIGLGVNASLEETTNSFATIFNMLGAAGSFDQGLGMAKSLIEDIRKDAAALPGEFQDFADMAKTLSAPLLNAGKGMQDIRNLTRDTVVATAALLGTGKGSMEMGAREMAQLLEGRAGAHNTLGTRLGIHHDTLVNGKEFNKSTDEERVDFLQKALVKAKDSLPAFQKSWAGLTSTMADDAKRLLGTATLPLFERMKTEFAKINNVLESPKAARMAKDIGEVLGRGFDFAVGQVMLIATHWDAIRDSAIKFGNELRDGFEKAWPIIEKIGGYLGEQLKDPGHLLGELALMRGGIALASNAPAIGQGISGIGSMLGGGGAAEGAAAGVSAAALAAVAVAAIALIGAFDVLRAGGEMSGGVLSQTAQWAQLVWRDVKENFKSAIDETSEAMKSLWAVIRPVVDIIGVFLLGALDGFLLAFRGVIAVVKALADAILWVIRKIPGYADYGYDKGEAPAAKVPWKPKEIAFDAAGMAAADMVDQQAAMNKKLHGAGKVTVNNNIQMSVMSESDPERFARSVATLLDGRLRQLRRPTGLATNLPG